MVFVSPAAIDVLVPSEFRRRLGLRLRLGVGHALAHRDGVAVLIAAVAFIINCKGKLLAAVAGVGQAGERNGIFAVLSACNSARRAVLKAVKAAHDADRIVAAVRAG